MFSTIRIFSRLALRATFSRGISTETNAVSSVTALPIVPRPRGNIDSPGAFLKAIGRGCDKYTEKFKDWDHLFKSDSQVMKIDLGIDAKHRKWILMWANKFRLGINPYVILPSKKHTMKRVERLLRNKKRGRK